MIINDLGGDNDREVGSIGVSESYIVDTTVLYELQHLDLITFF